MVGGKGRVHNTGAKGPARLRLEALLIFTESRAAIQLAVTFCALQILLEGSAVERLLDV